MTMNPHGSLFDRLFGPGFDRLFGPGSSNLWRQRAAWRAQRQAQSAAWKAANDAQRAAWKAEWRTSRWRYRSPFAAVWKLIWTAVWIGVLVLLVVSPEFRASMTNFMLAIPRFVVHMLYALAGRSEI